MVDWSTFLQRRRAEAASREQTLRADLMRTCAQAWPYGMPTSLNPAFLIVAVSPGASPAKNPQNIDYTPTLDAHPGLYYPDGAGYWNSIRGLAKQITAHLVSGLSEKEVLSHWGVLNLSTKRSASAKMVAEKSVSSWAMGIIEIMKPKLVVLNGLQGELDRREIGSAFNLKHSPMNWQHPDDVIPFPSSSYRMRVWKRVGILFVSLPNRLGRPPLTRIGAVGVVAAQTAELLGSQPAL